MIFEWEGIFSNRDSLTGIHTFRAMVKGGWLVKDTWWIEDGKGNECNTQSMIFIADPDHDWEVD